MFDLAQRISSALAEASDAGFLGRTLMPALAGCRDCGITRIITAPAPGTCPDCGAKMRVLDERASTPRAAADVA
ncbi:MAG TPA: hypothetical protein VF342_04275 [Alphaproteobacteria bacterium]